MQFDFSINPARHVETVYVGRERQPVIVLDDCLRDPQSLVNLAASLRFIPSGSHYPGVLAPLHPDYVTCVLQAIGPLIGPSFGLAAQKQAKLFSCFLALATTPPEQLHLMQRHPHVDTPDPGRIAVLHYLCDSSHGGTAFYRHRETGWESLDARQEARMGQLRSQEARPPGPGYLAGSNDTYEQTASIDAKFNRMLVYRSRVLHSAVIKRPDSLTADPRTGRLTANLFLEFALAS